MTQEVEVALLLPPPPPPPPPQQQQQQQLLLSCRLPIINRYPQVVS